jgi:hypothetical protein
MIYWRAYLDNVHPITKMVHGPSMRKVIELSCQNCRSVARNNMALLFSLHLAAINSMTDEECQLKLGTSRRHLSKKFLALTQLALVRVGLLRTTDFTVVTAYVAYLVSVFSSRICMILIPAACYSRVLQCSNPLGSRWRRHASCSKTWSPQRTD